MKWLLASVLGLSLACLATPADLCHEKLVAEHGCCIFHDDDCDIPRATVEQVCEGAGGDHDLSLLDETSAGTAGTGTDEDDTTTE